jgi:glutamate decarboxylase
MLALAETAHWIAASLASLHGVQIINAGTDLPVVCFQLSDAAGCTVFDLSDHLRQRGWVVPAYRMAADAESVSVLRIVVREGLSRDMAESLVADIATSLEHLRNTPANSAAPSGPSAPSAPSGPVSAARPAKPRAKSAPKTKAVC